MTELNQKTTRAVLWSALDVFMRQGVQFIVMIVLARILTPQDFGLIAILALFVGVANIFIDSGFSSALIQRQETTRTDESTVFFFNIGMGAIVALLLCAAAPWIATVFKQPVLLHLTYSMAFNVFVNAFGSIHTTLLTRELNFKTLAKIGGITSVLSGILAVILAIEGLGMWSLAGQTLAASMISVIFLWIWHPWRPVRAFRFASLRLFFRFGGYLLAIGIVDTLHRNLYSVLIGKYYSMRDVGFYDRAQKTQLLPVNLIMSIIDRVAYPVFSAVASDKEKLARGFRKAQRLVMSVNIPLLIGMIVLAKPIVLTLFGEQWLPTVPVLQVLGLVGLMWPLHVLNINVLKAQGRSDLFFNIMLIKKTVSISLTVAAGFHGVMAIAWAQVAASVFSFAVNAHYSKVFLNYGALRQMRDLLPYLAAAILAGLGMWLVSVLANVSYYIELILAALTGAALYLSACRVFHGDAISEIIVLLRKSNRPK